MPDDGKEAVFGFVELLQLTVFKRNRFVFPAGIPEKPEAQCSQQQAANGNSQVSGGLGFKDDGFFGPLNFQFLFFQLELKILALLGQPLQVLALVKGVFQAVDGFCIYQGRAGCPDFLCASSSWMAFSSATPGCPSSI